MASMTHTPSKAKPSSRQTPRSSSCNPGGILPRSKQPDFNGLFCSHTHLFEAFEANVWAPVPYLVREQFRLDARLGTHSQLDALYCSRSGSVLLCRARHMSSRDEVLRDFAA